MGGHLDTTIRGWSWTLAARVRLVISRLALIFVLPLDFHGRVRVVRSMYLPAALHGIEASFLASGSLRRLRSAIRRVVWSRRQPLASVGAVLSFLDGPTGCDPAFCAVWFRFRLLRRYLALGLRRLVGFIVCLRWFMMVVLGMVLFIFFQQVLLRLAFSGILMPWLGLGLVCLCLVIWLALFSISKLLFLMLGVTKFLLTFVVGRVFGEGLFLAFMVLCSSLTLLMLEKEIRPCFVPLWWVVSGMVFFLVGFGVRLFLVVSVVLLTMMVTGIVLFLLLLRFVKILKFMIS